MAPIWRQFDCCGSSEETENEFSLPNISVVIQLIARKTPPYLIYWASVNFTYSPHGNIVIGFPYNFTKPLVQNISNFCFDK